MSSDLERAAQVCEEYAETASSIGFTDKARAGIALASKIRALSPAQPAGGTGEAERYSKSQLKRIAAQRGEPYPYKELIEQRDAREGRAGEVAAGQNTAAAYAAPTRQAETPSPTPSAVPAKDTPALLTDVEIGDIRKNLNRLMQGSPDVDRLCQQAIHAARLQAELAEAKRGEESMTKMCDAYVTENQQLSDRAESAERDLAEARKDGERLDELQRRFLAVDAEWGERKETVLIIRWGNTPVSANLRATIDAALAPRET